MVYSFCLNKIKKAFPDFSGFLTPSLRCQKEVLIPGLKKAVNKYIFQPYEFTRQPNDSSVVMQSSTLSADKIQARLQEPGKYLTGGQTRGLFQINFGFFLPLILVKTIDLCYCSLGHCAGAQSGLFSRGAVFSIFNTHPPCPHPQNIFLAEKRQQKRFLCQKR